MKKVLYLLFASLLFLGACGNNGESKDNNNSKLSTEEQEETYKKESKKLGKAIVKVSEIETLKKEDLNNLEKSLHRYESKVNGLDSVETEIGDYAARVGNTVLAFGERSLELDDFKKENPNKEDAYDLANTDLVINMIITFDTINMDYEDFDIEYKNEYLGKQANEKISDLLTEFPAEDIQDLSTGYGSMIIEFNDDLNEKQIKTLENTDYREKFNKAMVTEEADVSKNEYNHTVDDFNDLSPEFLHYDKVNKMVSATENIAMMDIRNGVVGAKTDASVEDYESDSNDDDSSEEPVTRENVIDFVEEYEGESLDTDEYTFKEPEKTKDGEWGFSFTDKDGELAGSYIVDEDGNVTKYDEDGVEY